MQDPKIAKKSPSGHRRTTLSGCIFATKARVDNRKTNLLSSDMSSTRLIIWWTSACGWDQSGFNGFRVLAVLLHGTPAVDASQNLRRWTEGATYIRQGGHHVGHWPTFLVLIKNVFTSTHCIYSLIGNICWKMWRIMTPVRRRTGNHCNFRERKPKLAICSLK